tara:strand:- start:490 stop:798 length:309 start_codon:yes stop_codon:yes gene_type:complete
MKTTVFLGDFERAFDDKNRGDHFSWKGKKALFEFLEQEERDNPYEQERELDVIALCSAFTEYADITEFHNDYGEDYGDTMEDISYHTSVIPVNDKAFIILAF